MPLVGGMALMVTLPPETLGVHAVPPSNSHHQGFFLAFFFGWGSV